MQILYIEDDTNDARLVTRYVKSTPHQLVVINTIEEARVADIDQFDLLLVDVLLAHSRDGYALVKELRQRGFQQPMVAVTGLSLSEDIAQCYTVGFTDVLTKPYEVTQLAAIIQRYAVL